MPDTIDIAAIKRGLLHRSKHAVHKIIVADELEQQWCAGVLRYIEYLEAKVQESCPGHVAAPPPADPQICMRCGIHINELS